MVINATFNNISVVLWWSVLLDETKSTWRKPPTGHVTDKTFHSCIE